MKINQKTKRIMLFLFVLLFLIVIILLVGDTTITFNPFNIRMERWHVPVSVLLISIGFFIYGYGENKAGKEEVRRTFIKVLEQKIDSLNQIKPITSENNNDNKNNDTNESK